MKYNARKLTDFINRWLTREGPPPATPLCDFKRLRFEIRPGDVILVEGRSRVAEVIKTITQSPWSGATMAACACSNATPSFLCPGISTTRPIFISSSIPSSA